MPGSTIIPFCHFMKLKQIIIILVFLSGSTDVAAQSARLKAVTSGVSPQRILADVKDLAALGTRFSLSPDFGKATALVLAKLAQAGVTATLDPFPMGGLTVNNVRVQFQGSVPARPAILLGAHYDSITFDDDGLAPGAEDNASGVAGLLEITRLLRKEKLATPVEVFFFAGEEEGVWGSRHAAARLANKQGTASVQAMLNLDMIGYDPRGERHLLLDAFRVSRSLAGRVHAAALAYTGLQVSASINSDGRSDHRPFAELGVAALTLATLGWRDYPDYHSGRDLPENMDPDMAAEVTRATLATVLRLAGFADGPPVAAAGEFIEAEVGAPVRFSAASSFDPSGQALTFTWTRLDGPTPEPATTDPATFTFVPDEPGVYRYALRARSPDGRESEPDLAVAIVSEGNGCHAVPGSPESGLLVLLIAGWIGVRAARRSI